jgi:hypothetical protein
MTANQLIKKIHEWKVCLLIHSSINLFSKTDPANPIRPQAVNADRHKQNQVAMKTDFSMLSLKR